MESSWLCADSRLARASPVAGGVETLERLSPWAGDAGEPPEGPEGRATCSAVASAVGEGEDEDEDEDDAVWMAMVPGTFEGAWPGATTASWR